MKTIGRPLIITLNIRLAENNICPILLRGIRQAIALCLTRGFLIKWKFIKFPRLRSIADMQATISWAAFFKRHSSLRTKHADGK